MGRPCCVLAMVLASMACDGSHPGGWRDARGLPTAPTPLVPSAARIVIESTRLVDSVPFNEAGVRGCGVEVWARNTNSQTLSFRVDFGSFDPTGARIASAAGGMTGLHAGGRVRFAPPWIREAERSRPLACSEIAQFEFIKLELCEPEEPGADCWPETDW